MRPKIAFVFPGQGSQYAGMAKDLISASKESAGLLSLANEILERDVKSLILSGSDDELSKTKNTQPAVFLTNYLSERALRGAGIKPEVIAGHSLGEYNALLSAGVLNFESALRLIKERSALMERAAKDSPGKMAAVIGLSKSEVEKVLEGFTGRGIIGVANDNSPVQVVISGQSDLVEESIELLKRAGAKRVIELALSGPFHSPLMKGANSELSGFIKEIIFLEPSALVVSNLTAQATSDPKKLKTNLIGQMESQVKWVESVLEMKRLGCEIFIELGPKKVLSGLIAKTVSDVITLNVEDSDSLNATLSFIKEAK